MNDRRELSFDLVADEYERTRPTYPPELLDALPLDADAAILDVGAGTGKLTRVLVARYRDVTAVEPLANMRAMLERVVPGVTALAGSAEQIPLDDASIDGAFAAQAFHWFDKAVALPEIARVLRPGGVFAIVWNDRNDELPDPRPVEFVREVNVVRDAAEVRWKDEPRWEDLLRDSGLFEDVHGRSFVTHDHVLDRAGIIDNLRSTSWIASREDREDIVARVGALLPEATYAIPNRANVIWARKR
ncbi:MAG TPA: class I SAM-dependent methyltransferase [Gaiellaceae bacterium]|jgi:SAM-dependent methyltransferase